MSQPDSPLAQTLLVLHAAILIGALFWLLPGLVGGFGVIGGILAGLGVSWIGFCLPVIMLRVWPGRSGQLFSERLAWRHWWVPPLLLVQVVLVSMVSVMPHTAILTSEGALLGAMISLVHAPLHDAAWRGGFLVVFANRPRLGLVLSWLMASAAALPFALLFPHAPASFAGIVVLNALWQWLVWLIGSIFWVGMAHALSSTLVFWVLLNAHGV